jgi:hypothetical protein
MRAHTRARTHTNTHKHTHMHISTPQLQTQSEVRDALERNRGDQIDIARIKLMRKHWLDWLEGGSEELQDMRDPARHTPETRKMFLDEMKEAAEHGLKINIPTDEECEESLLGTSAGGRDSREIKRIVGLSSKMAGDLAQV